MNKILLTLAILLTVTIETTYSQTFTEIKKIIASDDQTDDQYGFSTDISGDYAVVGAPYEDTYGSNSGAAYIYYRNQGGVNNWGQVKKIVASDAASNDLFGFDVTIDGDNVVIGAHGNSDNGAYTGSAYVFNRNQGGTDNWGQVKKILASDAGASKAFGLKVELSGSTLIVGANEHFQFQTNPYPGFYAMGPGSAYIFYQNSGGTNNWGQVKKIQASDAVLGDGFGYVNIQGDYAVVGAHFKNSSQGAAYIFYRHQGGTDNWGQIKKLTPSVGAGSLPSYALGVSIFGDNVAIGGYYESGGGWVYVYNKNQGGANNWGQVKRFTGSTVSSGYWFATTVSLYNDVLVVGAAGNGSSGGNGQAYVFKKDQGGINNWGQTQILTASDGAYNDQFGFCVSQDGNNLIIGAPYNDDGGTNSGSAYIYNNCESIAATSIGVSPSQTVCQGTAVTLTVNGGFLGYGANWKWYSGSCGGTSVGTGNSISVTPSTTTTYYVRAEGTCNTTACVSVTITVNPTPSAPTSASASPSAICSGSSSTLSATVSSGSVNWYTNSSGTGAPLSSTTVSPTSTTTYYAFGSASGCQSSTGTSVTVTVNPIPSAPTSASASPSTICSGSSSTLSATVSSGSVSWYTNSSGTGAPLSSTTVSPTSTTTYYAFGSASGCQSSTGTSVTVTVNPLPSAPTSASASPSTICRGSSSTLSATVSSGSVSWYTNSSGTGAPLSSTTVSPTSTTTYYAFGSANGCQSSTGTSVTVTVNPLPSAPTSASASPSAICSGSSSTLSATVSSGSVSWYTNSSGTGAPLSSTTVSPTSTTTYYAFGSASGCQSATGTSVTVTVNPIPSAPTSASASPSTICSGSSSTLSATVSSGSVSWYTNSSGTGIPLSSATVSPTSTTTYYAFGSASGCQSSTGTSVTVTVNPLPSAPTSASASPSAICSGSSSTLSATVSSGSVSWYTNSSGTGAPLSSTTVSPTSTTTYYAFGSANGCQSSTGTSVTVTVNPLPSAPTSASASPSAICSGSSSTLSATVSSGSVNWYTNSSGTGAPLSSTTVSPTSTTTYYAFSSASGCQSSTGTSVTVTVNPIPSAPTSASASPSTICNGSSSTLSATVSSGSVSWYTNSSGTGIPLSSTTVSPTSTTTYYAFGSASGCQSSTGTSVTVTVNPIPSAPTSASASPSAICSGSSSTLSASGCSGLVNWYTNSSGTGIPLSSTTVSPTSTTTYYGFCSLNGCQSSTGVNVEIYVGDTTSPSIVACVPDTVIYADVNCMYLLGDYTNTSSIVVTDNCSTQGIDITITQTPIAGSIITSDTTVWLLVQDASGNIDSCSFNVTISDSTSPIITTCIGDTLVSIQSTCEYILPDFTTSTNLTVTDNCSTQGVDITITQLPTAGTVVTSNTTVWMYATDPSGNSDSCSFVVTLNDTITPVIVSCQSDTTLSLSANCDVVLPDFTSSSNFVVTDNCATQGVNLVVSQSPTVGTIITTNTVVWLFAEDGNGNMDSCSFNVTVADETAPVITSCISDQSVETDKNCTTTIEDYTTQSELIYSDNCSSQGIDLVVTQSIQVGTVIDSDTTMWLYVTDAAGNVDSCSFNISLTDCDIIFYESFSPNGSGQNEYFYIENLAAFPNTSVIIYNRWGTEVFQSDDYKNNWDGTSKSKYNIGGDELPEGTYYYLLTLGGDQANPNYGKVYKGYVYLKR